MPELPVCINWRIQLHFTTLVGEKNEDPMFKISLLDLLEPQHLPTHPWKWVDDLTRAETRKAWSEYVSTS